MKSKKNLIIGTGNILLSDEGIGVHIVKELEKSVIKRKNIAFLDMGTSSMDVGYYLNGDVEKMVVVDCIKSDKYEEGTVFKLTMDDLQSKKKSDYSLHQLGLVDSLKLNTLIGKLPETIIFGIVPYDIKTYSTNLSLPMQEKFPSIFNKIRNEISNFLTEN